MRLYLYGSIGLLLILNGCMVGPNYREPEIVVADEWHSCVCESEEMMIAWWQQFNDPLLTRYIEEAACYNKSLLSAETTVLEAMALRQVVASQLFPHLGIGLNSSRTYFSKNGPIFATGVDQTSTSLLGLPFEVHIPQIQNIFTTLLNASWTIDLFGKIRREVEVVDAFIGSAIEKKNDLLNIIIAEVAQNYIDLRSAQQQGRLIEENILLLEEEVRIANHRFQKGLTNALSRERIEAQLAELEGSLPPICSQIYQYIYAISLLTGKVPESLLCDLLPIAPLPCSPCEIGFGLRSELLRRRPDVRRAERMLAAANASIGVAVASFFPSLTLSSNLGLQSVHFSNLFEAASKTWSIGESVQLPIFEGGRLLGSLHLSESLTWQAYYDYQQVILTALQEAESALVAYGREEERESYLRKSMEHYRVYASLMENRFKKGLVGTTDLLESRRQLNSAEQTHLVSERVVLENLITLYKVLGGGWEALE